MELAGGWSMYQDKDDGVQPAECCALMAVTYVMKPTANRRVLQRLHEWSWRAAGQCTRTKMTVCNPCHDRTY